MASDNFITFRKCSSSYTKGVSGLDVGLQSAASGTDKLESGAGALSKGIKSYTENEAKIAAGIKS
ncbi:MAG: hypothetical protein ACLR2D_08155 [Anaerobutyricum hallii]